MQGPSQGSTYKVRIFCNNGRVIIIIIIPAHEVIGGWQIGSQQLLVGRTALEGDISLENGRWKKREDMKHGEWGEMHRGEGRT